MRALPKLGPETSEGGPQAVVFSALSSGPLLCKKRLSLSHLISKKDFLPSGWLHCTQAICKSSWLYIQTIPHAYCSHLSAAW